MDSGVSAVGCTSLYIDAIARDELFNIWIRSAVIVFNTNIQISDKEWNK